MEYNFTRINNSTIKYLIEKINQYDLSSSLEEKINLCAEIYENKEQISSHELFFHEECHQTIFNFIWKQRKNFFPENIDFNQLIDLLFNVLIIFEFLPINRETLIHCHFIKKFKVIQKYIKEFNCILYIRIENLINYWEEQVKNYQKRIKLLNNKRKRNKSEHSDNESIVSLNESENESLDTTCSFNCKKKNKKVSWKEDLVEIMFINTNEEPMKN